MKTRGARTRAVQNLRSTIFQTDLVTRALQQWLSLGDLFRLAWTNTGSWREVQATQEELDLRCVPGHAFSDADVASIVRRFPALRSLRVYSKPVSDSTVFELSRLPNLRKLDLTFCSITVAGIKALPENLESLYFDVGLGRDGIKDADAMVIAASQRCNRLRLLEITFAQSLTDPDAAILAVVNNCPNLKTLRIDQANVTDRAIIELAKHCDLESLDVSSCEGLTDASFLALAEHRSRLKTLNMSRKFAESGGHITDESILALSRCESLRDSLESLTLSGQYDITDASIVPLASKFVGLLELKLDECAVGDASVEAIGRSCKKMKRLALESDSDSITDSSIGVLAAGCPHLQELDLMSAAITDAFVPRVRGIDRRARSNKRL